MIVELPDKVRFVDLGIDKTRGKPPFVHSIEIGSDFVTFFVKTPSSAQSNWIDRLDMAFASHDNDRYHREDPNMEWVWASFGETRFRNHFHVLTREPQKVIEQLSISDEMKRLL